MRRSLLALSAGAILIGAALTATATAVPAAATSAGTYAIGDCYATGDFARGEITLSSKVPCSSAHSMQILGGTAIPAKLVKVGVPGAAQPVVEGLPATRCLCLDQGLHPAGHGRRRPTRPPAPRS